MSWAPRILAALASGDCTDCGAAAKLDDTRSCSTQSRATAHHAVEAEELAEETA